MEKNNNFKRTRTDKDCPSKAEHRIMEINDSVQGTPLQENGCKRTKNAVNQSPIPGYGFTEVDDLVLGMILRDFSQEFPVAVKLVCRRWNTFAASRRLTTSTRNRAYLINGELITTVNNSALVGSVAMLEWLRREYGNVPTCRLSDGSCEFKHGIKLVNAVKNDHLCVLQWIQQYYPVCCLNWDFVLSTIQHNRKDILAWLLQTNSRNKMYIKQSHLHLEAISYGKLEILEFLGPKRTTTKNVTKTPQYTECDHLSDEGLFDVMKWVSDNVRPWGEHEIRTAMMLEKPVTLKLLADAGCLCSGNTMMIHALRASSSHVIDTVDELIGRGLAVCDLTPSDLYSNALLSVHNTGLKWLQHRGTPTQEILQQLSDENMLNDALYYSVSRGSFDVMMYMVTNIFEEEQLRMLCTQPCMWIWIEEALRLNETQGFCDKFELFVRKKFGRDEPVCDVECMVTAVFRCGNGSFFPWIVKMGYITKDFVPSAKHYWDAALIYSVPTMKFMDKYSDRNAKWKKIVDMTLKGNTDIYLTKEFTLFLDYLFETKKLIISQRLFTQSIKTGCQSVFVWLISSFPLIVKSLECDTLKDIIHWATLLNDNDRLSDKVLESLING